MTWIIVAVSGISSSVSGSTILKIGVNSALYPVSDTTSITGKSLNPSHGFITLTPTTSSPWITGSNIAPLSGVTCMVSPGWYPNPGSFTSTSSISSITWYASSASVGILGGKYISVLSGGSIPSGTTT